MKTYRLQEFSQIKYKRKVSAQSTSTRKAHIYVCVIFGKNNKIHTKGLPMPEPTEFMSQTITIFHVDMNSKTRNENETQIFDNYIFHVFHKNSQRA